MFLYSIIYNEHVCVKDMASEGGDDSDNDGIADDFQGKDRVPSRRSNSAKVYTVNFIFFFFTYFLIKNKKVWYKITSKKTCIYFSKSYKKKISPTKSGHFLDI